MKPKEIEKLIKQKGWEQVKGGGKGSHRIYKKANVMGFITIPWHQGVDITPKTLNSILKKAGLK